MKFYNGSTAKVISTKCICINRVMMHCNVNIRGVYVDSIRYFCANEVRSGLVQALMLRQVLTENNIHIPLNGEDLADIMLGTSKIPY